MFLSHISRIDVLTPSPAGCRWVPWFLIGVLCAAHARAGDNQLKESAIHAHVAPIFERHCLNCHNDTNREGGLSLSSGQGLRSGGDSGPAILPGNPNDSHLIELITPVDGEAEMPQGAAALAEDEVRAIKRWIADGAPWPEGQPLRPAKWWSLAPLERPRLPSAASPAMPVAVSRPVPDSVARSSDARPATAGSLPAAPLRASRMRHPVDAFVVSKLQERGLSLAPEADRRKLIRRLSFDLLGLPPSAEQVERFIADPDPHAYERLVDDLLASPAYGERWGRHWLDVVHYGETHGYDKDQPRQNAWPYRDYVIRAFNEDKPYGQFLQEQIAGDVLFPNTRDGIEALGFIAAGPWDLIGHTEVPETKIDGKIARHLDRDDMLQNAVGALMSLTVGCAQCHDHKFDPVSQQDYYALQAVFAALDRADRPYDLDPQIAARRGALQQEEQALQRQHQELLTLVADRGGPELAALDERLAAIGVPSERPAEYGYHSAIASSAEETKWVQVDLGDRVMISSIELHACEDDFNGIGAGFGFPTRYKIEISDDAEFEKDVIEVADWTQHDVPNPGLAPQRTSLAPRRARFVRVTATRLAPRQNDYIFALAELRVVDAKGENRALGRPVSALDSIEAPVRWSRDHLVDGRLPKAPASEFDRDRLERERDKLISERVPPGTLVEVARVDTALQQVREKIRSLAPPRLVYAGCIHTGSESFRGTGADGGRPRPIYFLARGDVTHPLHEVAPAFPTGLFAFDGKQPSAQSADGERRAALAGWVTHRDNPLTWRSIANRIWLYHFGRGLVDTPDDFGRMGEVPTHPELLDWLACEIRDSGGGLKRIQRMLVTSGTYRQASTIATPEVAREVDPENRLYWRMNRRRLEAEAVRDALLMAAGRLDRQMGGPSYRDFVMEKPEHSPHYQYHLHDPNDPQVQRRTIYRLIVRSQVQPLMAALDCADPSMQVAQRNQSNTPLQALALMNNAVPLALSEHCATRARESAESLDGQVAAAFRHALSRSPSGEELSSLAAYARRHGLANACRVIINLNEFLFVD